MSVYATTVSCGLAVIAGCGRQILDSRHEPPPAAAIGATVMLCVGGSAYGCAVLTGSVTLRGARYPQLEHPRAEEIRHSVTATAGEWAAPVLWVFERGVGFDPPVSIGGSGVLWTVPEKHHEALRAAWRAAKERRG